MLQFICCRMTFSGDQSSLLPSDTDNVATTTEAAVSEKIVALGRRLGMNTDLRRAAFYAVITSDVRFCYVSLSIIRSANRRQLMVPRHLRSTFGRRAFSVAGPMEWNSLPDCLRDPARSTDGFRSELKTHLFAAQ